MEIIAWRGNTIEHGCSHELNMRVMTTSERANKHLCKCEHAPIHQTFTSTHTKYTKIVSEVHSS